MLGRSREVALGLKQAGEVVEAKRGIGMVGAERFLIDRQRALIERPRSFEVAQVLKQQGEIVEARRCIGMLGTKRPLRLMFFGGVQNGGRPELPSKASLISQALFGSGSAYYNSPMIYWETRHGARGRRNQGGRLRRGRWECLSVTKAPHAARRPN